jgi:hypothetical protein
MSFLQQRLISHGPIPIHRQTRHNLEIQRGLAADYSDAVTINSPVANATSYNNTGLTAATHYYYRLRAKGNGTTTTDSNWVTANATTSAASFDIWNDIPWVQAYNSDLNTYLAGSAAVDGGNVDEWRDAKHPGAVANPWTFQQADTAKQPVLRSTGINSKKAIEVSYDGTNAHQLSTDAHTGVPPTLTFVYINRLKEIPVAGYKILRSSAPDCNAYIHGDATGATGVLAVYAGAGPIDTSYSMVVDDNIIIEEVYKSGGGADVYVNGTSVGTGIAAGTAPTVTKNLMGSNDGTCGHFYRRHFFVLDRDLPAQKEQM